MTEATAKVLIVDDEKVIRDFLTRLLGLSSLEVKSAEDGYQAVELAKKEKFDVVFLDVRMPRMDGLETLRKSKKVSPDTKYVMMTGYAVDDLLQQAQKEGAGSSIRKPFDITQIDTILKGYTRQEETAHAIRILAVDDDDVILNFFLRLFKDSMYDVTTAKTGQDALAAIRQKDFDLVFLDLVLKDTTGVELYKKMQAVKANLNIILITGYPEEAEKMSGEPNIQCCLYKPFEIEKIFSEVSRVKKTKT